MIRQLAKELKAERARVRHCIVAAGIDPSRILLRARLRNWFQDLRHALHNVFVLRFRGLEENTAPGSIFRSYRRRDGQ